MHAKKTGNEKKTVITAALPYANGPIHLGHMVEYIQADIYARFLKLKGEKAIFICADDTHGTPIEISASKQGIKPEELIAKYYDEHSRDFSDFLISFDNYYTTNSPENKHYSDLFFNTLKEKGYMIQRIVELTFCENCSRYLPDRYVKGKCPKCMAEEQYGDSCEKCGAAYKTTDLIEPYCATCGNPPSRRQSLHYFFKLSAFSEKLEKWLNSNGNIQEESKNSVMDWIRKGLDDWDITRDGPYFGFLIPGETSKYYYVWLDAPIGYIASTENYCKNALTYWKNPDSRVVHFIGKDIAYFHFLFWPAMLMGMEYNLPETIKVHGFLTVNGQKMSKSRGTFITARDYLGQQEPEFLRFYYAANLSQNMEDINLDFNDFKNRINSELVDNIANFAYRVLSFCNNNFESKTGAITGEKELIEKINSKLQEAVSHYENISIREAVKAILEISSLGNQYFQENKPWHLIKTDKKKCHSVIAISTNILKNILILLMPITPRFAERLQKQMALENQTFKELGFNLKNHTINKARIIFTRIEGDAFKARIFPLKLRVARIMSAEDHPDANKLYVLKISLGDEKRQIVAGIREKYSKEELIGKKIVIVANLKQAIIRGKKSEGMMLAAEREDKLVMLEAKNAEEGDPVTIDGHATTEEEITFEDFLKIKLTTKKGRVFFNNILLKTDKGEVTADIGDGAKIR